MGSVAVTSGLYRYFGWPDTMARDLNNIMILVIHFHPNGEGPWDCSGVKTPSFDGRGLD